MSARLSVVIPWSNRPELGTTLAQNRAELEAAGAEVVVASCGGDAALLERCLAEAPGLALRAVHIDTSFNKALALNIGAAHASADTLFFLDCDLVLSSGACESARRLVSTGCVVTLDRVVESAPTAGTDYPHLSAIVNVTELILADGRTVRVETNRRRIAEGSRSAPGNIFLTREQFVAIDGMNSDLSGWGWEDLDLLVRLQLEAGARIERAGAAIHLTHGDEKRCIDGTSRASNEAMNAAMCFANYGLGYYYGTYSSDLERWLPGAFDPDASQTARALTVSLP